MGKERSKPVVFLSILGWIPSSLLSWILNVVRVLKNKNVRTPFRKSYFRGKHKTDIYRDFDPSLVIFSFSVVFFLTSMLENIEENISIVILKSRAKLQYLTAGIFTVAVSCFLTLFPLAIYFVNKNSTIQVRRCQSRWWCMASTNPWTRVFTNSQYLVSTRDYLTSETRTNLILSLKDISFEVKLQYTVALWWNEKC